MGLVARPFKQHIQIKSSKIYDDTIAAGTGLETSALSLADDLDAIRSQTKRILGTANWYTALNNRSLAGIDNALDSLTAATRLYRADKLTDIAVGAGQNFQILTVSGSEAPAESAAVGAVSTEGAVVAAHGGTFGTHSLAEVAGLNALRPKNLAVIVDGGTGDPILSGGKQVYALVHAENATDGAAFNDSTNRVQLSFVRANATADNLEAVPFADIAGKTINYSYVLRKQKSNLPEDAFISGSFVDQTASVAVTLNNAIDNQAGAATQAQHIDIDLSAGISWEWRDAASARLMSVTEGSVGGASEVQVGVDVDVFNIDAVLNDFANGVKVATGGTEIDIGVTAGYVESTGVNDLGIRSAGALYLDDSFQAGSTWAQAAGIQLSASTAEWDAYEVAFGGEVSLLSALVSSKSSAARTKVTAYPTVDIAAGVNVTGAGGSPNLTAQLPDHSGVTFVTNVDVYYDGELLINAANFGVVDTDVYPGTSAANGDLKFNHDIEADDALTVIVYG